jgi:dolichol kinase
MTSGSCVLYVYLRSHESKIVMGHIVLAIALAGFAADLARKKNKHFNAVVLRFMGPLMRRSEREGLSGLPFYALGCALSLYFYHEDLAILSIMFLIFSDPISSFFGVLYGKDKILPNKSLQGAVAGFFTCYLITLFYLMNTTTVGIHILVFAIVSGIIGASSELISAFNIDDNLTIPVLSGLGMTLLNHFVTVYP